MHLIILEIWRPISKQAEQFFDKYADKIISYPEITTKDYPKIVKEFYNSLSQNDENFIILSWPVSLNFQLGQVVWLNHFKVKLFQWNAEKQVYEKLENIWRNVLF